jgi:hypothetical protein
MKKIVLSVSVFALLAVSAMAQNNTGKADDGARIAITPQVTDQEIPVAAKNLLITKMKQICTKNGLAGDSENPFFIMDAKIDVLSKEITPTAPPMHALNMQLSLSIKDAYSGNVYSETSVELKGVGQNETKAYMAGLQTVNAANGQFKAMVDKGKEKILEFYNSQCDFVISKATAFQKQGNNKDATKVLKSVPSVCKECYDKSMGILATIAYVEEPAASVTNSEATTGMSTNTGSYQVEIATDIFLTYRNSKVFGDKLTLYFDVENRGLKDFELQNYASNTRIMDQNGAEKKIEQLTVGGNSNPYYKATIIPGIVVKMECVFPVVDKVSMFEFKYNDKTFRIKEIMLNNSTSTNAAVAAPVAAAATVAVQPAAQSVAQPVTQPATPVASSMLIGDMVLAHFNGEDNFYRKEYYPAKVQTLPSAATKGQTQLIVINSENPANSWTTDIITKWHKAAASELHDGSIVLYSSYELPDINSNYIPGVVVMTDELYKGIVSVKGWYGNVYKVAVTSLIIVDAPAYAGPTN